MNSVLMTILMYHDSTTDFYGVLACIALGFLIAFIVKAVLKGQMRSVAPATEARSYITREGLQMEEKYDHYTHTTVSRVYSPEEQDHEPDDDD